MKRFGLIFLASAFVALSGCVSTNSGSGEGYSAATPANKTFIEAARNGDLGAVKASIESGVNLNVDYGSGTALMVAAYNGHLEVVKYLLDNGADVLAKDGGLTAYDLASAAMNQDDAHKQIEKLLKEKMSAAFARQK